MFAVHFRQLFTRRVTSPRTMSMHALADVSPVLRHALATKPAVFDSKGVADAPVAIFYDLDLWDETLRACKDAFGPTFKHCSAMKSNCLTTMLRRAHFEHGFGVEAASIGELLHARRIGIPDSMIVFDSPCKTFSELEFALLHGIYTNLDNLQELKRAQTLEHINGSVGVRINPRVGAGTIAALSVSTEDSKFGCDISNAGTKAEVLKAYQTSKWLDAVHVHVGSGGMGGAMLAAGVRVAVDLALEINALVGFQQVKIIDVGGGLPANYASDALTSAAVPSFAEYADLLRSAAPELFSGAFQVVTEFGQSLHAKTAFAASRIEWVKEHSSRRTAIIHFGADLGVRQAYTTDHKRRFEAFRADGTAFSAEEAASAAKTVVGGPLCFQGDIMAKDLDLPTALKPGDFIVMKDAGSNTLSLFSRHCSRLAPPVYGFRRGQGGAMEDLVELKARETAESISSFWGAPDATH
ncbi:hypothetical protein M885DRAFT_506928 [Pelagophyceae sp. CCMP2097]|nr:hypothetical protein M885DRAFT_506928 [Pelagophyceae sp. CCMP2097]